jgi:hypothetical protein
MARGRTTTPDPETPPPALESEPEPTGNSLDPETQIPSAKPGDLGSFEEFAADDHFEVGELKTLYCQVGRPDANAFIRTYPDKAWWKDLFTLEFAGADGRRSMYLISPALRGLEELEGKVKRRRMVPYLTLGESLGLWPIGIESLENSWVSSAMRACEAARTDWIMPVSLKSIGQNKVRPAAGKHPDPKWPNLTLAEIIDLAFPPEKRITAENHHDHPVLARLRGE